MSGSVDLSQLPAPAAIESLDYETILAAMVADFRARDPEFTAVVESDPAYKVLEAAAYRELLLRQRVNDAVQALLPAFARGSDLDALVARNGITRAVVVPASGQTPAVLETDAQLLNRYLLSFDRQGAGTRQRYLFEAHSALPILPDGAVFVAGWKEHGRAGDVDVVACGPGGRDLTQAELDALGAAVLADDVVPEATSAAVVPATRVEYTVAQTIRIPKGPSSAAVAADVEARIRAFTDARTVIGAQVPRDFIAGAAFGPNVISAETSLPAADIVTDAYSVPVCTGIAVTVEVLS
jgi:phage-related baseplate assembly protein